MIMPGRTTRTANGGISYRSHSRHFLFLAGTAVLSFSAKQTEAAMANTYKKRRPRPRIGRPILSEDCYSLLDACRNNISIQETKSKGLGAFLGGDMVIKAGDWIGDYTGEILSRSEVEARYWNMRKCKTADRVWIKSRRKRHQGISGDYLFDMGDDVFLDAEDSDVSSWCRFMNHAPELISTSGDTTTDDADSYVDNIQCNVESRGWDIEDRTMPRLWFLARRDIACGEELLYDYGDNYWPGN